MRTVSLDEVTTALGSTRHEDVQAVMSLTEFFPDGTSNQITRLGNPHHTIANTSRTFLAAERSSARLMEAGLPYQFDHNPVSVVMDENSFFAKVEAIRLPGENVCHFLDKDHLLLMAPARQVGIMQALDDIQSELPPSEPSTVVYGIIEKSLFIELFDSCNVPHPHNVLQGIAETARLRNVRKTDPGLPADEGEPLVQRQIRICGVQALKKFLELIKDAPLHVFTDVTLRRTLYKTVPQTADMLTQQRAIAGWDKDCRLAHEHRIFDRFKSLAFSASPQVLRESLLAGEGYDPEENVARVMRILGPCDADELGLQYKPFHAFKELLADKSFAADFALMPADYRGHACDSWAAHCVSLFASDARFPCTPSNATGALDRWAGKEPGPLRAALAKALNYDDTPANAMPAPRGSWAPSKPTGP